MLRYQSDISFEPNIGPKSSKRVSFNDKDMVIFLPKYTEYGTTQFTSSRTSPARLVLGSNQPGGDEIDGGRFKAFAGSRRTPLRRSGSVSSLPLHDKTLYHGDQYPITVGEDVALKSILKKPKKITNNSFRVPTERRTNYFENTISRNMASYRLGELGLQDDTRKREATSFEFDLSSPMGSSKTHLRSPSWNGKNSFENKMFSGYKTQGSVSSYSDKFVVPDDKKASINFSSNKNYRSPTSNYADRGTITFSRSFPGITNDLIEERRLSKEINPSRNLTVQGSPVAMLDVHPPLSDVRKTLDNISATRNDALSKSEVPTNLHSTFSKEGGPLAHSGQELLSRSYTAINRASVPYSTAFLNKTGTKFASGSGSQESFVTHTSPSSATPYASSLYLKTGSENNERNFCGYKNTPEAAGVKTFRTATPYVSPNRTSNFASYESYSPSTIWLNERIGGNSFDRRFGHSCNARPHTSQFSRSSSNSTFARRPGTSSYK